MITIITEDDNTYPVDVDSSIQVENLKALLEVDTSIPSTHQQLFYGSKRLDDEKEPLSFYGISNQDLVILRDSRRIAVASGSNARASSSSSFPSTQLASNGSNSHPTAADGGSHPPPPNEQEAAEQLRLQILSDHFTLNQLRANRPELASAAENDPARFLHLIREERQKMTARLPPNLGLESADPFDIEAQRKIEEAIRQERVMENLEHAIEYSPESFGRVTMLYVDCKVNGFHVKAFVDSGAQATIMSPDCAQRCGIMRLLDTRFAGIARGVGTAKILGRVHSAQIQLSDQLFLPCSFTIMEGKGVEMLFGLDMLKRYQASIDLAQNILIIQNHRIRFLDEHELPTEAKVEYEVDQDGNPIAVGSKSTASASALADAAATSATSAATQPTQAQPKVPESHGWSFHHPSKSGLNSPPPSSSQSQPQPSPSSSSKWPDSSIQSLIDLGASQQQAIRFLDMAAGNLEVAASLFFQQ